MTTAQSATHGELLVTISNTMVGIYKELYGKGPVRVRSWYLDDLVVCVLRGGLTRSEQTFVEIGRGDRVALQRESFHEIAEPVIRNAIEELTGRSVETMLDSTREEEDVTTLLFLLEPVDHVMLSETDVGLIRQGQQMRRRATELRERSMHLRQKHEQLMETLRRQTRG